MSQHGKIASAKVQPTGNLTPKELLNYVRQIDARLQHLEQQLDPDLVRLRQVVPILASIVGNATFTSGEVIESAHLAEHEALREALSGLNSRQLGRMLARKQHVVIEGYVVERVGTEDRKGVWLLKLR